MFAIKQLIALVPSIQPFVKFKLQVIPITIPIWFLRVFPNRPVSFLILNVINFRLFFTLQIFIPSHFLLHRILLRLPKNLSFISLKPNQVLP